MNKAILLGRLTRDVEIRYSQSSTPVAVARFSIAVPRKFKREGEPEADFLNCVSFGKTAENINKFFSKGRMIAIVGHIQCGNYTNKEGQKVYTTDIIVDEFDFTGEKRQDAQASEPQSEFYCCDESLDDEDLPF